MEFFCEIDCNIYQQYFKNPGRGWHGRTIELEPALGGRKGSHRAPDPSPPQRADSNGRSEEVARVLEGSKIDVLLKLLLQEPGQARDRNGFIFPTTTAPRQGSSPIMTEQSRKMLNKNSTCFPLDY